MKKLLAIAALAVAAAPSSAAAAKALAVHQDTAAPQLLVPGDRVELGESTSCADLRIGPDGKLYRLSTSPTNGATISRYSVQP